MSQDQWLYVILVSELALILAFALGLMAFLGWRRRRRSRQSVQELLDEIRDADPDRRRWLQETLARTCGLQGIALDSKVREIMEAERAFYERFGELHLSPDPGSLRRIPEAVDALIRPYTTIEPVTTDAKDTEDVAPPAPSGNGDTEDIPVSASPGVLQSRIQQLAADVTLYRRTLNRLFTEYAAMFGVQAEIGRDLTAQEILDRMESGQLANPDDAQRP